MTLIPRLRHHLDEQRRLLLLSLSLSFLLFLPTCVSSYSLLPTPSKSPVDIQSPRDPRTGLTRFAYVALHYEGTPRDDEYVLGLRVMIHSLQQSGTTQDIVVLLSDNVRPATRQLLIDDGVKIQTVKNLANPFKDTTSPDRSTYIIIIPTIIYYTYTYNISMYRSVYCNQSFLIFITTFLLSSSY